jgi:ribonuclease HII
VIESPSSRGRFKINDEINNRKEIIYSIKQDWEDERNLLNLNMKNVRRMTEIIEELNKKYYS